MRTLALPIAAMLIAAAANTSPAQPLSPDSATEAAAVREVAAALVDDWNRHDMASFANLNVIGLWWHGRAEIQRQDGRHRHRRCDAACAGGNHVDRDG